MAQNPPPRDLAEVQAIVDKETGELRWRRVDERTIGEGIEHTKFIVCPALGVSACRSEPRARCTKLIPSPLLS